MAGNDAIPDACELARWVKPKFLARDDIGNVELDSEGHPSFAFPQAFELRPEEDYLSLTNVDYFAGSRDSRRSLAAGAIEASTIKKRLQKSSACVFGLNFELKAVCVEVGQSIRVLEEPEVENPAHVAVRRYPRDALSLYESLASRVFKIRRSISELLS